MIGGWSGRQKRYGQVSVTGLRSPRYTTAPVKASKLPLLITTYYTNRPTPLIQTDNAAATALCMGVRPNFTKGGGKFSKNVFDQLTKTSENEGYICLLLERCVCEGCGAFVGKFTLV